jgi:hypothetical protein
VIADRLLPACTVSIDLGGSHSGTGFFVEPGTVVTCHHVIEAALLASPEARPEITITRYTPSEEDGEEYEFLDFGNTPERSEGDLAFIRVEAIPGQLCAVLDEGYQSSDDLATFGYPLDEERGAPRMFVAEGRTGDKHQQFAQGQVVPGLSGSPLLNLRTGAVCGVVRETRDMSQPIGGYAVPISTLFELERSVKRSNRNTCLDDSRWVDELPEDQKKLMRKARVQMRPGPKPQSVFVISLSQEGEVWKVTAQRDTQSLGEANEVNLNQVRNSVARVFRDWATRGRIYPVSEQVKVLGGILSAALLRGNIRGEFMEALPEEEDDWLEVALHFDAQVDPELMNLPWEHLYVPGEPAVYAARDEKLALVRTLRRGRRANQAPPDGPLKVLLISAEPEDQVEGDDDDDDDDRSPSERVFDATQKLQPATVRFNALKPATNDELEDLVSNGYHSPEPADDDREPFHVLHYVGFGRFSPRPGEAEAADAIALGDEQTDSSYLNVDEVRDCLSVCAPSLVVLQLCAGPKGAVPADASMFARRLLGITAVEAVIAFQHPISTSKSIRFNSTLYEHLGAGDTVEVATQAARRKIFSANSRDFLSPALFVYKPGGLRLTSRPILQKQARAGVNAGHG